MEVREEFLRRRGDCVDGFEGEGHSARSFSQRLREAGGAFQRRTLAVRV